MLAGLDGPTEKRDFSQASGVGELHAAAEPVPGAFFFAKRILEEPWLLQKKKAYLKPFIRLQVNKGKTELLLGMSDVDFPV